MVLEIVRQTLYDFSALFCSKIQKLPLRCPGVLRTFKPGKKLPCSWARTGIRTYKIPRYAEKSRRVLLYASRGSSLVKIS
jgi:hypothetical protein